MLVGGRLEMPLQKGESDARLHAWTSARPSARTQCHQFLSSVDTQQVGAGGVTGSGATGALYVAPVANRDLIGSVEIFECASALGVPLPLEGVGGRPGRQQSVVKQAVNTQAEFGLSHRSGRVRLRAHRQPPGERESLILDGATCWVAGEATELPHGPGVS